MQAFLRLPENSQVTNKKSMIKGLTYVKQFITKEEQKQLVKNILQQQWNTTLKRRTQHYGYQYRYDRKNSIQLAKEISEWTLKVKERIQQFVSKLLSSSQSELKEEEILATNKNIKFNQLIINEYTPGQGINPHIDNPTLFNSPIVSLSLGSDCIMEFDHQQETIQIPLQKRSVVVLDGEARYEWKHSIPARKKDDGKVRTTRWSLTWRIMNDNEENLKNSQKKIKLS